jgi:hypothetical protein
MATTTNYGWTTPDDTSLVKDGAAAIRTLGSSVDTTTKALNPSTTLGDVEYRSATANTNTRLGIGTTGQVLTVTGGVPVWSTPASSGALTSIASGSLSTGTLSLTSISGSYKNLQLVVRDMSISNDAAVQIRFNNLSAGSYERAGVFNNVDTGTVFGNGNQTSWVISGNTNVKADDEVSLIVDFLDYANTTSNKLVRIASTYGNASTNEDNSLMAVGTYKQGTVGNAAIDRIDLILSTGTYSTGTYILYGEK